MATTPRDVEVRVTPVFDEIVPRVYPSRLMRILLAVREVALILWLAVGTVLGILALVFLAEFGRALDDRVTPDPTPLPGFTECVGEVC